MAFEQGSVSFRLMHLPESLSPDTVDQFSQLAAPSLESTRTGKIRGWVTSRHMLDRDITEEKAWMGDCLHLVLLEAERKIPQSLLRAECRMEELAVMAADGKAFLKRQERVQIKREVTERLLPQMPPSLKGMPFVMQRQDRDFFSAALSVKDCDVFTAFFQETTGICPVPLTATTMALLHCNSSIDTWYPTSFSPDVKDEHLELTPGTDFLTWLWGRSETASGLFNLKNGATGVQIQGPLTFTREGNGAYETTLRRGEPMVSAEARTCLLSGKKLKSAKIIMAQGDQQWECTLDAEEFVFRNVALPRIEEPLDPISQFEERMRRYQYFRDMFTELFALYVAERNDGATWADTARELRKWSKNRPARA